jgi:hypothetical protein
MLRCASSASTRLGCRAFCFDQWRCFVSGCSANVAQQCAPHVISNVVHVHYCIDMPTVTAEDEARCNVPAPSCGVDSGTYICMQISSSGGFGRPTQQVTPVMPHDCYGTRMLLHGKSVSCLRLETPIGQLMAIAGALWQRPMLLLTESDHAGTRAPVEHTCFIVHGPCTLAWDILSVMVGHVRWF